eukprot:7644976-Alexandrium_andersonii.AAC.1
MHRGRGGAPPALAAVTARGHDDARGRVRGGHGVASSLGRILDMQMCNKRPSAIAGPPPSQSQNW